MLEIVQLPDGFGKDQSAGRRLFRHQRIQRLESMAVNLIKAQADILPEPACHGCARHGGELTDAVDTQAIQAFDDRGRQTQACHRKPFDGSHGFSGRHDRAVSISRHGPGRARCIGDARQGVEALRGKPSDKIGNELFFSPEERRRARDIDPDSIRRTRRHNGRIADAPARQRDQSRLVFLRHGFDDMEVRHQRLTMRHRLSRPQSERMRQGIDGADKTPGSLRFDRHQRLIRRRLAAMAPDPVGRPGRQVERDDPSHHKPRESRNGVRRLGNAEG